MKSELEKEIPEDPQVINNILKENEKFIPACYDDHDFPLWVCACGKKHSHQFLMCGTCGGAEKIREIPKPAEKHGNDVVERCLEVKL